MSIKLGGGAKKRPLPLYIILSDLILEIHRLRTLLDLHGVDYKTKK